MPKSKPKPINWVAVRAEYEAGGVTLHQLADRLGVSKRTLERRCSEGSWVKGVAEVSAAVADRVSAEVREKVINTRVEQTLTILDMINNGIADFYQDWQGIDFKSKEGAVSSFEKLVKLKHEFSDEHIQEWLLKRGYVAVPIPKFSESAEVQASDAKEQRPNQQ